jgi:hypothetical protein
VWCAARVRPLVPDADSADAAQYARTGAEKRTLRTNPHAPVGVSKKKRRLLLKTIRRAVQDGTLDVPMLASHGMQEGDDDVATEQTTPTAAAASVGAPAEPTGPGTTLGGALWPPWMGSAQTHTFVCAAPPVPGAVFVF